MTVPWSLSTANHRSVDTTIGVAHDLESAITATLAATHDAIEAARASAGPVARYELRAGSELVAIIQTGVDEHGQPDHAETAALIARIALRQPVSSVPQ